MRNKEPNKRQIEYKRLYIIQWLWNHLYLNVTVYLCQYFNTYFMKHFLLFLSKYWQIIAYESHIHNQRNTHSTHLLVHHPRGISNNERVQISCKVSNPQEILYWSSKLKKQYFQLEFYSCYGPMFFFCARAVKL